MILQVSILTNVNKTYDPEGEEKKGRNVTKLENALDCAEGCSEGYYTYDEKIYWLDQNFSKFNNSRKYLMEMILGLTWDEYFDRQEIPENEPFFHLFNNSDNGIAFSGEPLVRLTQDFKDHLITVAEKCEEDDDLFIAWYDAMLKGFMKATKSNGAIKYN